MRASVYKVMLSGKPILMKTEDGFSKCGFVRNEYVLSRSEEHATQKAKEIVLARLDKKDGVSVMDNSPLELTVDEIQVGMPLWKLLSSESFIFFDLDEAEIHDNKALH